MPTEINTPIGDHFTVWGQGKVTVPKVAIGTEPSDWSHQDVRALIRFTRERGAGPMREHLELLTAALLAEKEVHLVIGDLRELQQVRSNRISHYLPLDGAQAVAQAHGMVLAHEIEQGADRIAVETRMRAAEKVRDLAVAQVDMIRRFGP